MIAGCRGLLLKLATFRVKEQPLAEMQNLII